MAAPSDPAIQPKAEKVEGAASENQQNTISLQELKKINTLLAASARK